MAAYNWQNVNVGSPDAGMGYALQGSRMLASALQNLNKPLDEYNMAQKENALNKQKANTGAYKDQILQGKKPDLKGFYNSEKLADARRQYLQDSLEKKFKEQQMAASLANMGIAKARASREAQRFNQDLADRAAMNKARESALAGMTSAGTQPVGSPDNFTSYDDMNHIEIPKLKEDVKPFNRIEPIAAAKDLIDFKNETPEPSYKEEAQANSILDQRLANAQKNRADAIAAARPGQTGLHDLAVADQNYRKELQDIAIAKNKVAQSADSKDQAFQNQWSKFQTDKLDRKALTPKPFELVELDPNISNAKDIRSSITDATKNVSQYKAEGKNRLRNYFEERIRMAKTKEDKNNLRKEEKTALETIDSAAKPQEDLIKTWDKRLASVEKDNKTATANSKLNMNDIMTKLQPKGNDLIDESDKSILSNVIKYVQTRYPRVSNKRMLDFIQQHSADSFGSKSLFDYTDQFYGDKRFGVDSGYDDIITAFDAWAKDQGIKAKLKK